MISIQFCHFCPFFFFPSFDVFFGAKLVGKAPPKAPVAALWGCCPLARGLDLGGATPRRLADAPGAGATRDEGTAVLAGPAWREIWRDFGVVLGDHF